MSDWMKQFEEKRAADAAAKLAAQQARWNATPEEKKAAPAQKNASWKARNLPRLQAAKRSQITRDQARIEAVRSYKDSKEVVAQEPACIQEDLPVTKQETGFLVPAGVYFAGDVYRGKVVASVSKARRSTEDDEFGADVGGSDYVQHVTTK